jgi:mRNA interferase MazF
VEGLVAGDAVTVPFPFTDFSSQKVRPALILTVLDRGDVLLCQITSRVTLHTGTTSPSASASVF